MILTSTRITTGSGKGPLWNHLQKTQENEAVAVLAGSEQDLQDWIDDARHAGAKYGLRHLTINPSPDEPLTRDQAMAAARVWVREFGGDPDAMALVEHSKKRSGQGQASSHWHAVFPEFQAQRQRVLDAKHDYARNELVARTLETRYGHKPTQGWHNVAVAGMARDRGMADVAQRCEALAQGERPQSAFSKDQHQRAKRLGIDLAQLRDEVRAIYQRAGSADEFTRDIADEFGLKVQPGRKAGVWILADQDGEAIGSSIDRLVKQKKGNVAAFMRAPAAETTQEVQHERPEHDRKPAHGAAIPDRASSTRPRREAAEDRAPDRQERPASRREALRTGGATRQADVGAGSVDAGAGRGALGRGQDRPDPGQALRDRQRPEPQPAGARRDRQRYPAAQEQRPSLRSALTRLFKRSRLRARLRGLDLNAAPESKPSGPKFGGRGGQDLEL